MSHQLYTIEEIKELKLCMDPVTGPEYFLRNFIFIESPIKGQVLFEPYDFQIEMINNWHTGRRSLSVLSRQIGLTHVAAAYLLWNALFTNNTDILYINNINSIKNVLIQRILFIYNLLPNHISSDLISYSKSRIIFDNGSKISALSSLPDDISSTSCIFAENISRFTDSIALDIFNRAILSLHNKCIIASCPYGDKNLFATMYLYAATLGINVSTFAYNVHPEHNESWANECRIVLGAEQFAREFACKFLPVG